MTLTGKLVIAVIQARTGSTRLPGKVLRKLAGHPSLFYVLERSKRSRRIDKVVLATTRRQRDTAVADLGEQCGIEVYRGPENDVLSRFNQCLQSQQRQFNMLVRVNADNFLICPEIIDLCLDTLESRGLDIVNPFLDNTYPFGCGAEVATMETFRKVERETRSKTTNYREHIFFYAYDHPELFSFDTVVAPPELSRPGLNLSVDTRSEFDLLASFFETQGAQGALKAGLSEIISYFEGESRE